MSKPETMMLDDVKYVRADSVSAGPDTTAEGWDYCIVRSRDQGVVCGYVESIEGATVRVHKCRQMWRWDSRFVLQDLAEFGPRDAGKCQFSSPMSEVMTVIGACGVLTCTESAAKALREVVAQSK